MRLLLLLSTVLPSMLADGYVEEVTCSATSLTIVVNRSDPEVVAWVADPNAQPVLYVFDHKTRVECGTSLKNEKGEVNYNLTVPYGNACDIQLTDIEPSYKTAETTVVLEDNSDQSHLKVSKINHVFCLYTRKINTIRFNQINPDDKVVASTGGKPMPKVDMIFRSTDGLPLHTAKLGDDLEFYVALTTDNAYKGIAPKECMFSDREDPNSPEAKKLTFVQNGCPMEGMKEIIAPLANVNNEVYFSKFKTFRFGQTSTVFVHCTVLVCIGEHDKECSPDCFKKVHSSNLKADRLRFRHRRSVSSGQFNSSLESSQEMRIRETLTILDNDQNHEVSRQMLECPTTIAPFQLLIIITALGCGFILSTALAIALCCRLKRGKDTFEVFGAYATSMTNSPHHY